MDRVMNQGPDRRAVPQKKLGTSTSHINAAVDSTEKPGELYRIRRDAEDMSSLHWFSETASRSGKQFRLIRCINPCMALFAIPAMGSLTMDDFTASQLAQRRRRVQQRRLGRQTGWKTPQSASARELSGW